MCLVPDPSPISQSGITFFNTLFDENASNHLAIGAAYATSVEGGAEFTEEELEAAGLKPLRRPRRLHDRLKPNGYRRHPRRRNPCPSLPQWRWAI